LIVKPSREDASAGVEQESVVWDFAQLVDRVNLMFEKFSPPLLIEEFIEGKELHISILGNNPPEVLPMIEFDFSELPADHPTIITYEMKWNPLSLAYHQVHSVCPAQLSKRVQKRVERLALRAYLATSCRDYARVDMRLSKTNKPYVLEVNPNPDLTESVSYMESAEAAKLSFSKTLRRIVELALDRAPRQTARKDKGAEGSRGGGTEGQTGKA
jgi:D-alanine-D-alanine ligase